MKTEKELNKLKEEYTELNKKLAELSENGLKQVVGGVVNHEGSIQEVIGPWDITC